MNYIFGYGSLLSEYSRRHYSGIQSTATVTTVEGWSRAWCATYPDERATYAGACRDPSKQLDGVLIASDIDKELSDRERGYQFTLLNIDQLMLNRQRDVLCESDQVWVCERLAVDVATAVNPLPQSYVDTCISGCLEAWGIDGAKRFIQQTKGWDCVWVNDRHFNTVPIYPRYTPISAQQSRLVDDLLEEQGVLQFRQPISSIELNARIITF